MGAYILRFPRAEILTLIPLGLYFPAVRFPRSTFSVLVSPTSILRLTSLGSFQHWDGGGGIAYWAHAVASSSERFLALCWGCLSRITGKPGLQDLGNLQALD